MCQIIGGSYIYRATVSDKISLQANLYSAWRMFSASSTVQNNAGGFIQPS
jgi:hypothetical protein